ncbi:unnamed protein product [Plutella xylostella]|uniref:Structure-specific endonuclease subunit SLX4 n=1 Tax=Plutella xylostella TaxID=51655 RepID=A0A8S4F5J0_PLUXY|nr:unnamed protein product [Plutella xylostella]
MNNLSSQNSKKEIVSKYFKDKKQDNDESVSEFQEPKKTNKGPKTAVNAPQASTASKSKKRTKKIKGQKDIRAVLNKKNELVKYAKEFDQVCKISGIDVDSEQLQLAIALSKSLQETITEENVSRKSKILTAEERSGKIRTTLQEYGFRVPEVKLQATSRRRLKGKRKQSKLLLLSEAEKQQIITDKYSQVCSENTLFCESSGVTDQLYKTAPLYHIATNSYYEYIKYDDRFYVDGLLEKSPNTIGSLLRDWSEIPGRPLSPVLELNIKYRCCELEFSCQEISDILSGTIEKAQYIIKRKADLLDCHSDKMEDKECVKLKSDNRLDALSVTSPQYRCASPDLFDEEDSEILSQKSTQHENVNLSPPCSQISSNVTRKKSNDFMDLTECINLMPQPSTSKTELSEVVVVEDCDQMGVSNLQTKFPNITQRKSNDFMEITNCIATCGRLKAIDEDNIDLTQGSDNETGDDTIIIEDIDKTFKQHDKVENFDLTQSSNSNDTLPIVHISGTKPVVEEINLPTNLITKKSISPIKNTSIFEEYVYEHSDHSSKNNGSKSMDNTTKEATFTGPGEEVSVDLTQSSESLDKTSAVDIEFGVHESNIDVLGKKDDISIDYDEVLNYKNYTEETKESLNSPDKNINLENVYDYNDKSFDEVLNHSLAHQSNHDDFHIHTSDITANNNFYKEYPSETNYGNEYKPPISDTPSEVFEISDEELNYSIHKSKYLTDNSKESNEISVEIPKGNFECGGLSILDNISAIKRLSENITIERDSMRKSVNDSLPIVEIRGSKVKIKSPLHEMAVEMSTPVKDLVKDKFATVNTPNNSEYVIKTNQVTPMVDYASLSTPERNKELDKYGLKPFKRKRAIQLLTHLYNQTHPVVETCSSEDLPSPSKKLKPNTENNQQKPLKEPLPTLSQGKAETKGKSPRKTSSTSPRKAINIVPYGEDDTALSTSQKSKSSSKSRKDNLSQKSDRELTNKESEKENISYVETSCVTVGKDVKCCPDDWVFQKREKAKVHSCRLPLHIAFHNYVSSRRGLREAILRYEPVNIDVIHKDLVGYGHRYDPKDLLRFLDKKCITVKTADNNARNKKK